MSSFLTLKRVVYGKKSVPQSKREYIIDEFNSSAVGTISEIMDFIKNKRQDITSFHIVDTIENEDKWVSF